MPEKYYKHTSKYGIRYYRETGSINEEIDTLSEEEFDTLTCPLFYNEKNLYLFNSDTGLYAQGNRPHTRKNDREPSPGLTTDTFNKISCFVHGVDATYVGDILKRGTLVSAFARLGPMGKYGRTSDRDNGGASAVYTRMVGTRHKKWPAQGKGCWWRLCPVDIKSRVY